MSHFSIIQTCRRSTRFLRVTACVCSVTMQHILIVFITLYRRYISPFLPPACRFYPTCSEYGIQAIQKYGAFKGSWMTLWRVLRCHPFSRGGYDPVK